MITSKKNSLRVLWIALLSGIVLASCQKTEQAQQSEEAKTRPMVTSWSSWGNNALRAADCGDESLINGAKCRGSYCDDVAVRCVKGQFQKISSQWSKYFSEENADKFRNKKVCNKGEFVTAIRCKGRHCNSVAIECTEFSNVKRGEDCHWTPKVSEENGGSISFGSSKYVAGVKCHGKYCDNMNFLVCDAAVTPPKA
ncbi:MAG: hypothetical protein MUC50_16280 [Myxococcota bacterium]|jgi:hypothetical protein|nr:hypothetical protein [Myxococcota bacterium]